MERLESEIRALPRPWVVAVSSLTPQPAVGSATAALAVLALLATWRTASSALVGFDLSSLGLATGLAGAVVFAYQYPIHARHQTKVYLFTVVYFLLAVLTPPLLAAVAAGAGALAGEISRRASSGAYLSDMATEAGRRVPQVLLASLVAHLGQSAPPSLLAIGGAVFVLALLDAVSLPLQLAPMTGERPLRALGPAVRATAVAEGVQYAVGVVGAAAALTYPWTLPLLAVPAALVYMACKILQEMHDSTRQLLENMADAVDLRDAYTGGHSRRVTEYSAQILRSLGFEGPEVDLILAAARVHDIGKIGIPDAVLNKDGKLSDDEWVVMKAHPVHGAVLLKRHRDFARGIAIVRGHHESWDGSGYPDGLAGLGIPFGARVIAVADSFDAMTSDRPYRKGMPIEKAVGILRDGCGRQWDAAIVAAFLHGITDQIEQPSIPLAPRPVTEDRATVRRFWSHGPPWRRFNEQRAAVRLTRV